MRRLYGNTYTAGRQRSRQLAHHRFDTDVLGRLLVFRPLEAFGTIKKLPIRRSPHREVVGYSSRNSATTVTAIFRIRLNSFSESTTSNLTKNHLLSMKPRANPPGLALCFALVAENMPPRKKAPPVYTEVA
jgi:hypothetical protein